MDLDVVGLLHTSRLSRWERRIEVAITTALDACLTLTLDQLSMVASGLPSIPFEGPEYDQALEAELRPTAEGVLGEVVAVMVDTLDAEDLAFPVPDFSAQVARLIAKARGIGPAFAEAIGSALTQGVAAGEGIPELSDRVRGAYRTNTYRATTIARTETLSAVNGAQHDTAGIISAATGEELAKTWIATDDPRTRPTHDDADGQTITYGQAFTVGLSSLAFPGDPTGPAEEVINCRCAVAYRDLADVTLTPPSPPPPDTP